MLLMSVVQLKDSNEYSQDQHNFMSAGVINVENLADLFDVLKKKDPKVVRIGSGRSYYLNISNRVRAGWEELP